MADIELTPIVVAAISSVVGLISGAVGSFLAPWANWGVEKRRLRLTQRKTIIDDARRMFSGTPLSREQIRGTIEYAAIRSHLPQELINRIEQINVIGGER